MSKISISNRATEKILNDWNCRSTPAGAALAPCLAYFQRSYVKLNEGRIVEHGSGLILSFIEQSEARQYRYLAIDLDGGCTVFLAPSAFFQAGAHFIDWVDHKFKLEGVGG